MDFITSKHITVNTILIGTDAGGNIMNLDDGYKDALPDEAALKSIAETTYGTYTKITTPEQSNISYNDIMTSGINKLSLSVTPLLLSLVILLIGFEWLLSFTRFSRVP